MISNQTQREVGVNSTSTTEFSIKNSAKMFNMIISGLYSDKPKSITREIWSNAFDAHCMVGKHDVPFKVTLPTSLVTTFTCRDYGPGIHHDDMAAFYTVLGHSTKEDTNDAVGKWGVGRMSPMSYTDSFTVVSRHQGRVAYYSVQMGADGAPKLHTLQEPTPTTEEDGLEISFPIQRRDLHLFERAAKDVSLGFSVKPVVEGQENYEWPKFEPDLFGDGWSLFSTANGNSYFNRGNVYAKMGYVIYPVPNEIVGVNYSESLLLEFDIGELEVTASREGLSFGRNDPTKDAILAKFNVYQDKVEEVFLETIKNSPTYFEAVSLLHRRPKSLYNRSISWQGELLETSKVLTPEVMDYPLSYSGDYELRYKNAGLSFNSINRLSLQSKDFVVYISVTSGPDRDVRAGLRIIKHHKATHQGKSLLWFKSEDQGGVTKLTKMLKARLGDWVTMTPVSTTADPGAQASTRSVTLLKKWQAGRTSWDDYSVDDTEFKAGGVYLPISNNDVLEGQNKFWLVAAICGLGSMVVVPKTHWKKFENATNWKPLWEYAGESILVDLDKKKAWASEGSDTHPINFVPKIQSLNVSCPLVSRLKSLGNIDTLEKKFNATRREMLEFLTILNITVPVKNEVKPLAERVLDKYPLLKHPLDAAALQEYVEGVNLLHKTVQRKAA